jgi:hypothetical protein
MDSELIACYTTPTVSTTARVSTVEGVDEVLEVLLSAPLAEPPVLTVRSADPGTAVSHLVAAVNAEAGAGALRYTSRVGEGSSSWHTAADEDAGVSDRLLGFPASAAIPLDRWRAAIHAYHASGGQRPSGVAWLPVPPGSDATSMLAEALLALANNPETRIETPEDVTAPDTDAAPVSLPVAAGHLRAAKRLLRRAARRLELASLGSDRLLWSDARARLVYAATQLSAVVPDRPNEKTAPPTEGAALVANIEGLRRQLTAAAVDITDAHRRLRAALECPDLPVARIARSVEAVLADAPTPVEELIDALP